MQAPAETGGLSSIWSECVPEPNTGCWIWSGATDPLGRAITDDGRLAELLAWTATGEAVPPGHSVHHSCRVPCCMNPAHFTLRKG